MCNVHPVAGTSPSYRGCRYKDYTLLQKLHPFTNFAPVTETAFCYKDFTLFQRLPVTNVAPWYTSFTLSQKLPPETESALCHRSFIVLQKLHSITEAAPWLPLERRPVAWLWTWDPGSGSPTQKSRWWTSHCLRSVLQPYLLSSNITDLFWLMSPSLWRPLGLNAAVHSHPCNTLSHLCCSADVVFVLQYVFPLDDVTF